MKNVTLSEWEASSPENRKLLAEESLILEASEAIWTALEEEGLSKSELAAKLKVSKSHVTQLLDGSRNMTLRTLANLADVLGRTARIELRRENIDTEWIKANGIANVRILRPQQALRAHANDDGWQPLERAGGA